MLRLHVLKLYQIYSENDNRLIKIVLHVQTDVTCYLSTPNKVS